MEFVKLCRHVRQRIGFTVFIYGKYFLNHLSLNIKITKIRHRSTSFVFILLLIILIYLIILVILRLPVIINIANTDVYTIYTSELNQQKNVFVVPNELLVRS